MQTQTTNPITEAKRFSLRINKLREVYYYRSTQYAADLVKIAKEMQDCGFYVDTSLYCKVEGIMARIPNKSGWFFFEWEDASTQDILDLQIHLEGILKEILL